MLRQILADSRSVAVVGLSDNWHRPSNFAAKYMLDHGYRVVPVNPMYAEVLGQRSYASLREIPEPIDIVNCFRRAEDILPLAIDAIAMGAKVLWMQLGIVNIEAATLAADAGLQVVMDRCIKIEHARLFGGLNFVGVNTRVISSKRSKIIVN